MSVQQQLLNEAAWAWFALAPPAGFGYTPPVTVESNHTEFRVDPSFDLESQANISGTTYYVDGTNGDDTTGDGSSGNPYKTIHKALTQAGDIIALIAPGHYPRDLSTSTYSKSLKLKRNGSGRVICSRALSGLSWTLDGTYTNTYKVTAAGVTLDKVLDAAATDGDGDASQLTQQADAAAVDANPGSWHHDGSNVLWVRTADDREPDGDIWPIVAETNLEVVGEHRVYCEGIDFVGSAAGGGTLRARNSAAGQALKVYARDCSFKFGANNGVHLLGVTEAIFQDCVARANSGDGFTAVVRNTVDSHMTLIDCVGSHNGTDDASDNDNGASNHDAGALVIINGRYDGNVGPNIAQAGSGELWAVGVKARDSAASSTQRVGITTSSDAWLDTCWIKNNAQADINVDNTFTVYTFNCNYATTSGLGTVTTYDAR